MKVVVVDDEKKIREGIVEIITNYCPEVNSVFQASNVSSALEVINRVLPDILILDISLGDETSFDLLEQLNHTKFKIIFVTAFEEYALKAIKISALDYLIKPVNPKELIKAVNDAVKQLDKNHTELKLDLLLANVKNISEDIKKIILKTAGNIFLVNVQDIIRCESDDYYTNFYLDGGKKIMVSKTLKEYEDILSDSGFFRTHQSHMINLNFLIRYDKKSGGIVFMKDNSKVPVSSRKRISLLKEIDKLGKI